MMAVIDSRLMPTFRSEFSETGTWVFSTDAKSDFAVGGVENPVGGATGVRYDPVSSHFRRLNHSVAGAVGLERCGHGF